MTRMNTQEKLILELSIPQARAAVDAFDLFTRLSLGQFRALEDLIRQEAIKKADGSPADMETCEQIDGLLKQVATLMGFGYNSSRGIGNPNNSIESARAYEIKKVVEKALAVHNDPNPSFRGVNYDGLIVRYTQDPAPNATITSR